MMKCRVYNELMTVLIIHGIGGNAQENWFPWMKTELEQKGIETIVPDFPDANAPMLDAWLDHAAATHRISSETILVGHSLGAAFALRLLERSTTKVCATFLVSPVWKTPQNKFAPLMITFTEDPYDWEAIRENAGSLHIVHGGGDPYLSEDYARELGTHLKHDITLIPGGGHLNASAGYTTFPALRDSILTFS